MESEYATFLFCLTFNVRFKLFNGDIIKVSAFDKHFLFVKSNQEKLFVLLSTVLFLKISLFLSHIINNRLCTLNTPATEAKKCNSASDATSYNPYSG